MHVNCYCALHFDAQPSKHHWLCSKIHFLAPSTLQVWHIKDEEVSRLHGLDSPGHRSDIRTVALSSDDSLLLSGSNNEVKIWNPRSGACLRTIEAGYGLCALFAPGNRHAVVGTKEGTLDVLDVGASSRLQSVEAHAGAVWSLAALPDNRYALKITNLSCFAMAQTPCISPRTLKCAMVWFVWYTVWHV